MHIRSQVNISLSIFNLTHLDRYISRITLHFHFFLFLSCVVITRLSYTFLCIHIYTYNIQILEDNYSIYVRVCILFYVNTNSLMLQLTVFC